MSGPAGARFNALIRTHHITSKKKIIRLKDAADNNTVYALLRTGSPPGIMYVEGLQPNVEAWIDVVERLRYKDYWLVARPAEVHRENALREHSDIDAVAGCFAAGSVKDFAAKMQQRGVFEWWRKAMGYVGSDDRM